jgi:hypothetical protein
VKDVGNRMSTGEGLSKEQLEETVLSFSNYLEVLVKRYPEAITQKELAELASVTPAAVSKIKDKIFPLCNVETLAYESKMVLKPNLFILEKLMQERMNQKNILTVIQLFGTRYSEDTITKTDIHNWISEKIPFYSLLFTEEESQLGAKIILRYIRTFSGTEKEVEKAKKALDFFSNIELLGPQGESLIVGALLGNSIGRRQFEWPIDSDVELLLFIQLRDKVFHILMKFLSLTIVNWSIFDQLKTTREKTEFKKVYESTFDFYMKKVFTIITDSLEIACRKKNLKFKKKYKEIGQNASADFLEKIEGL